MATPHRAHHIIPINLKISLRCRHNIHAVRTVDCRMELEGIQDESRMMWYAARRRINIRHEMQLSWSIPTLNSVINQIQFIDFYPRSDIQNVFPPFWIIFVRCAFAAMLNSRVSPFSKLTRDQSETGWLPAAKQWRDDPVEWRDERRGQRDRVVGNKKTFSQIIMKGFHSVRAISRVNYEKLIKIRLIKEAKKPFNSSTPFTFFSLRTEITQEAFSRCRCQWPAASQAGTTNWLSSVYSFIPN